MIKREMVIDTVTETEEGGRITTYRLETRKEARLRNRVDLKNQLNKLSNDHPVFFEVSSFLTYMGAIFVGAAIFATIKGTDDSSTEE